MRPVLGEVEDDVARHGNEHVDPVKHAVDDRRTSAWIDLACPLHERAPTRRVRSDSRSSCPPAQRRPDLACEHDGPVIGVARLLVSQRIGGIRVVDVEHDGRPVEPVGRRLPVTPAPRRRGRSPERCSARRLVEAPLLRRVGDRNCRSELHTSKRETSLLRRHSERCWDRNRDQPRVAGQVARRGREGAASRAGADGCTRSRCAGPRGTRLYSWPRILPRAHAPRWQTTLATDSAICAAHNPPNACPRTRDLRAATSHRTPGRRQLGHSDCPSVTRAILQRCRPARRSRRDGSTGSNARERRRFRTGA